jgi:competence protein ComFC
LDCIAGSGSHSGDEPWGECVANRLSNSTIQQEHILTTPNHEARFTSGLFASNTIITKLAKGLLDLIFPPMCHGCGRVDTQWCDVCLDELVSSPIQIKEYEHKTLTGLCATGEHIGKLQQAIQAFKYHDTQQLADPLGKRLATALVQKRWTFDTIIPVPLHADRQRERGYNQAYLLSQQVGNIMNIPCQPQFLTRHRDTGQQVSLNAQDRRDNVKDAFMATADVAGQSILLIDDVVTTGATLDACATALFNTGAKVVYAMTVSHA